MAVDSNAPEADRCVTRVDRAAWSRRYRFPLDQFQIAALDAIDEGCQVVVAAPTGSGKTLVAEYAIERALANSRRAFYTAPIKALSNQKFRDLQEIYGDTEVGLLTGDHSIAPHAPVVVMTTEVLRNMIYTRSDALEDLEVVIVDEVHFLQDAYRGPVWEEIIIQLDPQVQLVSLSATVSNAEQLGEWIESVRGTTRVIVERHRPVRLDNFYLVGDRSDHRLTMIPTIVGGAANPEGLRFAPAGPGRSRRYRIPGRVETVRFLARRSLIPALYFIFSRQQCDDAVSSCVTSDLDLTSDEDKERIRTIAASRLGGLDPSDLAVLGVDRLMAGLERGIGSHHAGLVPAFKEVVELCFVAGLVKVVFATETLAVGINMPARAVVIERLTRFTGERHQSLTPGEYTQLTGRAGRRGIDERGSAVVLWSPFVAFADVARLVASREFHLRSAFRPTYNMAANLVLNHDEQEARGLVAASFAQFQADREVTGQRRRHAELTRRIESLRNESRSPFGDIDAYRRESTANSPIERSLEELRPGDVIEFSRGRHHGPAVVVATAQRRNGLRLTLIGADASFIRCTPSDFDQPVFALAHIELPQPHGPQRPAYRREVAARLGDVRLRRPRRRGARHRAIEEDPDLRRRLRAAERADRLEHELESIERRLHATDDLTAAFDRILKVLETRGYLDRNRWRLTPPGTLLTRIFHESDLLICECLRAGVLDGFRPDELAGLVSMFVYEERSPDQPLEPWYPNAAVAHAAAEIMNISRQLGDQELSNGLVPHRPPDPGFVALAYAWTAGEGFAEVVEDDISGGDFVRTMKQLIDLLRQIADACDSAELAGAARTAARAAYRDVIADSSILAVNVDEP